MVSFSCFLSVSNSTSYTFPTLRGRHLKIKGLCPLFKRQRPGMTPKALCGTTLVDAASSAPSHGLPSKPCTLTAATGSAYQTPSRVLRQAAPGGLGARPALCLAAPGSSLYSGIRALLFPIHAFDLCWVNYTINRAVVNRRFVT